MLGRAAPLLAIALVGASAGEVAAERDRLMPLQAELGFELAFDGDSIDWGGRLAAAYVQPLGDRTRWQPFAGIGLTTSYGGIAAADPTDDAGTVRGRFWTLGPELRLGLARDRRLGSTRLVAKAALITANYHGGDIARRSEGGTGARFGLAVASPAVAFRDRSSHSGNTQGAGVIVMALAPLRYLSPTEVELTLVLIDGDNRGGFTLGYAF